MVEASALSNERVCRRLGHSVGSQLRLTRTLMELEIGTNLGPAACESIGKALAVNQCLIRLSFADSNMGDASFGKLVNGLRNNTYIREINLSGCGLTDASGTAIGSILRAHASRRATAQWQDNLRCYPGSAAARDLAARQMELAAMGTGGLTALNLSYNNLTVVTVKAMCASLHQDTRLTVLRMKGNKINEAAAAMLGQAMKEHPRLVSVELQSTQVPDVELGVLRVVPGSEVSMPSPDLVGGTTVKKEVFMDMDVAPTTPRAVKTAAAAAAASEEGQRTAARRRPSSAPPARRAPGAAGAGAGDESDEANNPGGGGSGAGATQTAAGQTGWYEGRRGWSPASSVTAPTWKPMGDHANSTRVPQSMTAEGSRPASARPASAAGTGTSTAIGTKKKLKKRRKVTFKEPQPVWGAPARPKSAMARSSVLGSSYSSRGNTASGGGGGGGGGQEKQLVDQLTRALSTLEERLSTMDADELREHVAAAARAATTASKLTGMGGRSSASLAAKVTQDLQALERICS